jgi:FixJ family two-component response regulator
MERVIRKRADSPYKLGRVLRADGWPVSLYASAEEFLQASSPDGTACLILDIDLPGISTIARRR